MHLYACSAAALIVVSRRRISYRCCHLSEPKHRSSPASRRSIELSPDTQLSPVRRQKTYSVRHLFDVLMKCYRRTPSPTPFIPTKSCAAPTPLPTWAFNSSCLRRSRSFLNTAWCRSVCNINQAINWLSLCRLSRDEVRLDVFSEHDARADGERQCITWQIAPVYVLMCSPIRWHNSLHISTEFV